MLWRSLYHFWHIPVVQVSCRQSCPDSRGEAHTRAWRTGSAPHNHHTCLSDGAEILCLLITTISSVSSTFWHKATALPNTWITEKQYKNLSTTKTNLSLLRSLPESWILLGKLGKLGTHLSHWNEELPKSRNCVSSYWLCYVRWTQLHRANSSHSVSAYYLAWRGTGEAVIFCCCC